MAASLEERGGTPHLTLTVDQARDAGAALSKETPFIIPISTFPTLETGVQEIVELVLGNFFSISA